MRSTVPSNRVRPTPFLERQSDENLVAQAKLGSEQAFTELWSRHGERVRSVIWRIIRNREDVEDILQEAYLKSFLHLVSFNGESQFSTWLSRIGINLALMLLRKRRNHPEVFIEGPDSDSTTLVMDFPDRAESVEVRCLRAERVFQLRMAIEQLPPKLKYLVELQNRDELPLEEIANRMGISLSAVKSRLVRARAALRELTAQPRSRKSSCRWRGRPREMNRPSVPVC
jgi:RNA polymerase sigma-70 factor, ECF subfamily